jgi:hypothetical protein
MSDKARPGCAKPCSCNHYTEFRTSKDFTWGQSLLVWECSFNRRWTNWHLPQGRVQSDSDASVVRKKKVYEV